METTVFVCHQKLGHDGYHLYEGYLPGGRRFSVQWEPKLKPKDTASKCPKSGVREI
jgi:hypothetical protein